MRVGSLRASSPEEPPLHTWAVSDERVGKGEGEKNLELQYRPATLRQTNIYR